MTDNDLFSLELNSNTESSSPSTESDNNLFIDNATNGGRNLIHRLDNDLSRNHFDIGVEDKKEFSEEIKHVSELLKQYQSLTIIPQSSKVIVLDTEVSLRAAFQALEENEIDSAPLWDSYKKDYIGVITIGDLIKELIIIVDDVVLFDNEGDIHRANILTEQNIPLILERLEDTTIKDIYHNNPKIISIDPSDSLYDVCWTLVRYNIHRVPVIDKAEQNLIIFSLSGSRIISFLMKIITDIPSLFQFTLENLKIGSFMNIKSIQNILTLGEVLRELTEYGYAALPIVDENGHLVETIYKSDISRIPHKEILRNYNQPICEYLSKLYKDNVIKSKINTCYKTDNFETILIRMIDQKIRSLIVIDEKSNPIGIVSLGDIMNLFIE